MRKLYRKNQKLEKELASYTTTDDSSNGGSGAAAAPRRSHTGKAKSRDMDGRDIDDEDSLMSGVGLNPRPNSHNATRTSYSPIDTTASPKRIDTVTAAVAGIKGSSSSAMQLRRLTISCLVWEYQSFTLCKLAKLNGSPPWLSRLFVLSSVPNFTHFYPLLITDENTTLLKRISELENMMEDKDVQYSNSISERDVKVHKIQAEMEQQMSKTAGSLTSKLNLATGQIGKMKEALTIASSDASFNLENYNRYRHSHYSFSSLI